jgi:hypothetical protein
MTTTRTPERVIESHPIYHRFYSSTDYVQRRNSRGHPRVVRREERCEHCPTVRLTRIDVKTWLRIGKRSYRYVKGVVIVRVSRAEWNRQEFLATTTLTGTDLEAIT